MPLRNRPVGRVNSFLLPDGNPGSHNILFSNHDNCGQPSHCGENCTCCVPAQTVSNSIVADLAGAVASDPCTAAADAAVEELLEILDRCTLAADEPIEPETFVFSWGGIDFAPKGNLFSLKSSAKSGKTFFLTALMNAFLTGDYSGIKSNATPEESLLYVDTEMCRNDTRRVFARIKDNSPGQTDRCTVLNLRTVESKKRLPLIDLAVQRCNPSLIVVDGIIDLAEGLDYNDNAAADHILSELARIAEQRNALIIVAIHTNRDNEHACGWFGKLCLQKSAVELLINREKNGATRTATATAVRHIEFPDINFTIEQTADGLGKLRIIGDEEAQENKEQSRRREFIEKLHKAGIDVTKRFEIARPELTKKIVAKGGVSYNSAPAASAFVKRCIECGVFDVAEGSNLLIFDPQK